MISKSDLPRIALGSIFVISGLNGFFNFMAIQGISSQGIDFIESLKSMGFMWTFIKSVELIAGTLLLFNVAGQLGVLLLAPICVGIFFFHAFLSPSGSALGWIAIALEIAMIVAWRKNFLRIFFIANPDEEEDRLEREDEIYQKRYSRLPQQNQGAGIRSVKTNRDIDAEQEQEMVANKPS